MPIARQILNSGQSAIIPNVVAVPMPGTDRALVDASNLQVLLIVPLKASGQVVGLLTIGADDPDRDFTPAEVALAETIASPFG